MRENLHTHMMNGIILAIFLLGITGCASPGFIVQPVKDDPSLFVGTARASDGASAETPYTHPVVWDSADLQAILKRVAIQDGSGLMDASRHPQAVFSQEDLRQLIPALQQAFSLAGPSDWVVFAVWGASQPSQALEVTSGGLFLQEQHLHILVANHRERVSSEEEGIQAIRQNPLSRLRDVKRNLLFFPTNYIVASGQIWLAGGFDSPVSEVILDYQGLLESEGPAAPTTETEHTVAKDPRSEPSTSSADEKKLRGLQEEISTLKEELSRLKQQMKPAPADSSPATAP